MIHPNPAVEKILTRLVEDTFTNAQGSLDDRERALLADPRAQAELRATMREQFVPVAEKIWEKLQAKRRAAQAAPPAGVDPEVQHIAACLEGDPTARAIRSRLATISSEDQAMAIVTRELLPIVVRCARSWQSAA